MKVLQPGHKYELANFINKDGKGQKLQFIFKSPTEETIDGTTNEEVISVLIDRLEYLDGQFPCQENKIAIHNLKLSLMALNKRTADRENRGVEGEHKL